MSFSERDLAYLAGFFDGEGSISFGFGASTKKGIIYWYPHIQLSICNTDKECMEFLQKKYALGNIYTSANNHPRQGKHPEEWHDLTTWRIGSKDEIDKFLHLIEPYVLLKTKYLILCRKALEILSMEPSTNRDVSFRQIVDSAKKLKTKANRGRKRKYDRPNRFQ